MARDASLDDFAAGTGDETGDAATNDETTDEGAASGAAPDAAEEDGVAAAEGADGVTVEDPSAVEPAVPTSTFAADGAACASCGASTRRLWTAEGDPVCADCKPW